MKDIDRVTEIERLTSPVRYGRLRVQRQAILLVPCAQHRYGIRRYRGWQRHFVHDSPIGPPELKRTVRLALEVKSLLLDRAMVPATQKREIRELRGPALSPVTDVVRLPKTYAATREAAPVVPVVQCSPKSRRDRAGPGADFRYAPVRVMTHDHPVASQARR